MLNRKLALALVLVASTPLLFGQGCGGSSNTGNLGKGGKDGGAGTTAAGGTTGTAGTSAAGTTGTAGTTVATAGTSGIDAAAGSAAAGADGGTDDAMDAPVEMMKPDGSMGISYLFDTTAQMWKYTQYGSTPNNMPNAATNLAYTSTLAWDGTNDVDNKATSGSLKGTVPFKSEGDRIDFQAFGQPTAKYDWTGYTISAKVKLVSGGNLKPGCPMSAWLYVSQAPDFATALAAGTPLVTGQWVTLTFDMGNATVNVMAINQMGIQITTGVACDGTPADGGADGGTDAASDASDAAVAEAGSDAADGGASDASDAATDLLVDAGLGDVIDAVATDAATDATEVAPPPPITAGTAIILIDSVIVSVK